MSRLWRWASALENLLAVEAKKLCVRFGQLFWQTNRLARKWNKILFECWLRKEAPQSLAQNNAQLFVERDKPGIKSSVMQRRKAKSVSRLPTHHPELPSSHWDGSPVLAERPPSRRGMGFPTHELVRLEDCGAVREGYDRELRTPAVFS